LARKLGWAFIEGDDFHPPENIDKLSRGVALQDDDRWPWLQRLAAEMERLESAGQSAVLACSALKESYRSLLQRSGASVAFVWLDGSETLIEERLRKRDHFMNPSLLRSQYETLEPPLRAIRIDAAESPQAIIEHIQSLRLES
jgi:gluconokinase